MSGCLLQMSGVVVDVVHRIRALPRPGGEAEVRSTALAPGGGFNAMVAARRAGMAVRFGGSLGTGPFAELAARALEAEGIALPVRRDPARDQGICTVLVEDTGERSFIGGGDGANAFVDAAQLAGLDLAGCGVVLVSGYALAYPGSGPALAPWLGALPPALGLVFDPAPVVGRIPAALLAPVLARADWVSANAAEALALTGRAAPAEAAAALAEGRRGGAVVRLGADGAILGHGGAVEPLPAPKVRALDTNGAGDAHLGWFIAGLAEGLAPAAAVARANAAAALSTTRAGPATAPDRAELDAFLGQPNPSRQRRTACPASP